MSEVKLYDYCRNRHPDCFCQRDNTKAIAVDRETLSELQTKAQLYDNAQEDIELGKAIRRLENEKDQLVIISWYEGCEACQGHEESMDTQELIKWNREQSRSDENGK